MIVEVVVVSHRLKVYISEIVGVKIVFLSDIFLLCAITDTYINPHGSINFFLHLRTNVIILSCVQVLDSQ